MENISYSIGNSSLVLKYFGSSLSDLIISIAHVINSAETFNVSQLMKYSFMTIAVWAVISQMSSSTGIIRDICERRLACLDKSLSIHRQRCLPANFKIIIQILKGLLHGSVYTMVFIIIFLCCAEIYERAGMKAACSAVGILLFLEIILMCILVSAGISCSLVVSHILFPRVTAIFVYGLICVLTLWISFEAVHIIISPFDKTFIETAFLIYCIIHVFLFVAHLALAYFSKQDGSFIEDLSSDIRKYFETSWFWVISIINSILVAI
ncbi:hypothetical protein NEAUS03_2123 [Nematocida ausubeli]|nr:hypothetical protein NEAUS03_2123 [Nematocida ausubeli]